MTIEATEVDIERPRTPGDPTDLVPLTGAQNRRLVRIALPPILVSGSSGGAGVTTTVLGLASAAATGETTVEPVCVDATPFGNDLALRGCDHQRPASTVQAWLDTPVPSLPSAVAAATGATSTGARIMSRTAAPFPRRETYMSVHHLLLEAGTVPIYDAGAPVSNRFTAPLLTDPRVGLAVVAAGRPDAINRFKPVMTWLDEQFSEFMVSRAVLVVTQQIPGVHVTEHVRTHLGEWVRAVIEIPFDPHLAEGGTVSWNRLAAPTRQAYRDLIGELQ